MDNTKLYSLLSTFSKKDLISFEKMLVSPYFGFKGYVLKLFLEVKKYYPLFENINKKELFRDSFPGKTYNDVLLRKSLSLLAGYATRYIKLQLLEFEPELAEFGYVNHTRRYKQFKLCEQGLRAFDNAQESSEIHFDFYLYRYMMEREKVFHKLAALSQKDACEAVVTRNEYLLLDFIYKFAMGLYEMDANRSGFNHEYTSSPAFLFYQSLNFDKFMSSLDKDDKNRHIYEICTCSIKMAFQPDDKTYFKLKSLVMEHYKELHFNYTFGLYAILSSYSMRKFKGEHFAINKFMLENKFFLNYGAFFQLKDFIRVFRSALDADEILWAEDFLKNYIKYISPAHEKNTLCYSNALICFYRKQYNRSLEYLSMVKYQLFSFKLDVNIMALQIHYELGNLETSLSLIDSYKHFLRENRFINEASRNRYDAFIASYTKLLKVKLKQIKINKSKILEEIRDFKSMAGKQWLIEKINEW
jgi:hypothetical protein